MQIYLKKSNKRDKKWMVYVDGKTIHFGAAGMSDYTIHKDMDRMKRYENRHRKRENWSKSGIKTAGFWSKWLLWNKPSFQGSKNDIEKRFGVKITLGWPNQQRKKSESKSKKLTEFSIVNKKSKRKSRKLTSLSIVNKKSKRKSRKPISKYERCVLAVKSKQPKKCFSGKKWKGGSGCFNPWAVCTSKVGKNN